VKIERAWSRVSRGFEQSWFSVVYNIVISFGTGQGSGTVKNMNGGIATVEIPYTADHYEYTKYLYAVYVEQNGIPIKYRGPITMGKANRSLFRRITSLSMA